MLDDEIDIAFGTNQLYAPHVGCVIASIVRNAPGAKLRFIVLHDGISDENQARMQSIAPRARFVWIQVGDDDVPAYPDRGRFSRAILYRLGLDRLAPTDCRRVIYLDADVIVLGDLRELWRIDLGDAPIGAVVDAYVDPLQFAQRWGLTGASSGYFNSGVLLIDLDQVRAEGLFSAAMSFVQRHGSEVIFADQDALNYAAWGRWRALPPTWNTQRHMVLPVLARALPEELRFHEKAPNLVHYTESEKPWVRGAYHPWSWLYWENLARTPFFAEVAASSGVGALERLRLWLRWMRRQPARSVASGE